MSLELQISHAVLYPMLARAAVISKEKSPMAALRFVVLEAGPDTLRSLSTDTFQGMDELVPAKVGGVGKVAVDAKHLAELVKCQVVPELHLKHDGDTLILKAGKGRFKVPVLPHEDFPELPSVTNASPFATVAAADLVRGLAQGSYAMRDLDAMPQLNATYLDCGDGELRLVSTDSLRLAVATIKATCGTQKMLLPAKAVGELRKIADANKGGTVEMLIAGTTAFFVSGGMTFSSKLIDMPFAPYRKFLRTAESSVTSRVTILRDVVASAVQRVALVSEGTEGGTVNLTFSEGSLRIHGASTEAGDGEDFVDCDASVDMSVRVNPKMFCDAVNAVPDEEVQIDLTNLLGPMLIGSASGETRSLVMPRS